MKTFRNIIPYLLPIIPLLLISFTTRDSKSEYNVPLAAYSVTTGDIDLDGDNDIIVGHNYNSQTQWSGVSFMINNGDGTFFLNDSIFLYSWQTNVYVVNTDSDTFPEIIARHYENETQYMAVLNFEQGNYFMDLFPMTYGISGNNIGDINGDSFKDIVIYSNDNQFWGVLYNDATGNFSSPWYYNVQDYYPSDIACADLNGDGREDIVVVGQKTEVYFSYSNGFQLLTLETNDFKGEVHINDLDMDGKNDISTFVSLYIVNYSLLKFYKNIGSNNFIVADSVLFQPACNGSFEVADFNNDSLPDFLFHNLANTDLIIYYNEGNFTLSYPQYIPMADYGEVSRYSACADYDGNGFNDIATIRYLHAPIINLNILFNDGNGNFQENPITDVEIPIPYVREKNQIPNLVCYPNPFTTETTISFT
ncbi:MAG: VCBS repeat-containing protein, partial [Bacteroidales bacterium]|nr:VCBS repeat-containing protein [Bacteroidales bacterium]